jgi:hypothetical protein
MKRIASPGKIARSLSEGMVDELRHTVRSDGWPGPRDMRSALALQRRGLISVTYCMLDVAETRITPLGALVHDEIVRLP